MRAAGNMAVLSLDRQTFVDVLGPLQNIMAKEKSDEVRTWQRCACASRCSSKGPSYCCLPGR